MASKRLRGWTSTPGVFGTELGRAFCTGPITVSFVGGFGTEWALSDRVRLPSEVLYADFTDREHSLLHFAKSDRHVGVAGEIKINLERKANVSEPRGCKSKSARGRIEHVVDHGSEIVGDEDFPSPMVKRAIPLANSASLERSLAKSSATAW